MREKRYTWFGRTKPCHIARKSTNLVAKNAGRDFYLLSQHENIVLGFVFARDNIEPESEKKFVYGAAQFSLGDTDQIEPKGKESFVPQNVPLWHKPDLESAHSARNSFVGRSMVRAVGENIVHLIAIISHDVQGVIFIVLLVKDFLNHYVRPLPGYKFFVQFNAK